MKKTLILFSLLMSGILPAQTEGTLLVLNKSDDTVDLINLSTGKSELTLPTGDGPHEVAVSPDSQWAVVTNYGRANHPGNSLTVIDLNKKEVKKTLNFEYQAPHGIEFISDRDVLVTCEQSKKLILVDIISGKVKKAINTDQETSHMVAYHPASKRAFVANIRSNSVSVINLNSDSLEKIINTGQGAEGIALSADGQEVWVTNRSDDTVTILDTTTLEIINTLKSKEFPIRAKTTSDGKYALVSNAKTGDVSIFDAENKELLKTISMGISVEEKEASRLFQDFDKSPVPVGILIHPNNRYAYVANTNADIITILDLQRMEIAGRLTAGREPDGLGIIP